MVAAELVLDCRNTHGEGVFWNAADARLWWTDIHGKKLWWFDPATEDAGSIDMPDRVCCFAPRATGGFLLALAHELALFDPKSRAFESFFPFEPDNPNTRLNDGRTDRNGNFVAGGMNEITEEADSSVVLVTPDLQVRTVIEKVSCANSICFSPDGRTMYFTDTPDQQILAYDYDAAAVALSTPRPIVDMHGEPGIPDGSCVDAEGYVWNAEWMGRRVIRIAPDGRIDRVVEVPVDKPTCCAFGGTDLDTLYITTSRLGSTPERLAQEANSGGLFAMKTGVKGLEDVPFAG